MKGFFKKQINDLVDALIWAFQEADAKKGFCT